MREATQSAVIIPVAAAEAVVAEHRRDLDLAASWGVPAHVTILFPFVPPSALDADVVGRLGAVIRSTRRFGCTFSRCEWFGEDVLWLAPDQDKPFRRLTLAVSAEFPDHPPYGGAFEDVVPHLTIGDLRGGTVSGLRAAETVVRRKLPVTATIDHALLIAGTDAPGSWRTVATLPLGAGTA